MKKIIPLLMAMFAICINAFMGGLAGVSLGLSPIAGASGGILAGLFMHLMSPAGSLVAGVLVEVWTGEMVKKLNAAITATWLDGIPDYSDKAENDVIHLIDVGADPDVLINNTTYPIPIQDLPDADISIKLDKYQTKATRVTDDELYALSYDKMASVKERHSTSILENKFKKAIHALAPSTNGDKTPVIFTTGANDGSTRRRMSRMDIIAMKDKFDKMGVPSDGRRLVLCSDHVNDLLATDQKFADQYYNFTTGKIANMYGFEVYEYVACPFFTANGNKKVLGSAVTPGQYQASIAFYTKNTFKCNGSTKMYFSEASNNPTTQENLINFRHRFIVLPKKLEAIGAIVSATYVAAISVDPTAIAFPLDGGVRQAAVSSTSDFVVTGATEGFVVVKNGNVLTITATDNTAGADAKACTITLTLTEDVSKTATITLTQPKAA